MLLVTGAAGYVGSHFLLRYLDQNKEEEVVVVDNLSVGSKAAVKHALEHASKPTNVHFEQADVGDQEALDRVMRQYGIDAVVHFAASAYVGESQRDPFKYYQNNLVQSINLFEAMERNGVRKIVFSSTCATYGNPQYLPIDEAHEQRPVNVYGSTKLMLERILAQLSETRGWSFVALRYFNAAGADPQGRIGESHDPETHLIPLVLQAAAGERSAVEILGDDYDTPDGTCIRDYIHVFDLADAHWQALNLLKTGTSPGNILENIPETIPETIKEYINLGTSTGASVKEVIRVCERVSGCSVNVTTAPRRSGDPPVLVANAEKAAAILQWRPKFDLESTVETAWRWQKNRQY